MNHKIKTFAIISHPDAGKTTFTEQLLLISGSINSAGTVKARKSNKHATSDWMALEKQRGISVSTSVMKFKYHDVEINLLDTPGHGDFSEDTYRTLTAVDCAIMVIDAAKGVEERTIKLMSVCRLRDIPIITFINKLDRESKDFFELLDDIENVLGISCIPITWPAGSGKLFKGLYNTLDSKFYSYKTQLPVAELKDDRVTHHIGESMVQLEADLEMIVGAIDDFADQEFLQGKITPVYFGSAINAFGIEQLLQHFIKIAPHPKARETNARTVLPTEDKFTGFVFKIQANMDPKHHDRIAFLRIVSGKYHKGMKVYHPRVNKYYNSVKALNLFAQNREEVEVAYPGDIIGIHNYGNINIGDTFTEGEKINFKGIPNFAPELFRVVRLRNPLKQKSLIKGLTQLCQEGATQVFRPLDTNEIILGAIGILQFDVVSYRLLHEYGVDCTYHNSTIYTARWITIDDKYVKEMKAKFAQYLAYDGTDSLVYLAPSRAHLNIMLDKYPDAKFASIKE